MVRAAQSSLGQACLIRSAARDVGRLKVVDNSPGRPGGETERRPVTEGAAREAHENRVEALGPRHEAQDRAIRADRALLKRLLGIVDLDDSAARRL